MEKFKLFLGSKQRQYLIFALFIILLGSLVFVGITNKKIGVGKIGEMFPGNPYDSPVPSPSASPASSVSPPSAPPGTCLYCETCAGGTHQCTGTMQGGTCKWQAGVPTNCTVCQGCGNGTCDACEGADWCPQDCGGVGGPSPSSGQIACTWCTNRPYCVERGYIWTNSNGYCAPNADGTLDGCCSAPGTPPDASPQASREPAVSASPSPSPSSSPAIIIPNCKNLTGPDTLLVGETGTYQAEFYSSQGELRGRLGEGNFNIFSDKYIDANTTNFIVSGTWVPTAPGTYTISCRAWNDSVAECRKSDHVEANKPQHNCIGPNNFKTVTVTQAADNATIINGTLSFDGVPANGLSMNLPAISRQQDVLVKVVSITDGKEIYNNKISFSYNESDKLWHKSISLNIPAVLTGKYVIKLKGPAHRQILFCRKTGQTPTTTCTRQDAMDLAFGTGNTIELNASSYPLEFGDVVLVDQNGKPNLGVTINDYSAVKACKINNATLNASDAKYHCTVNDKDVVCNDCRFADANMDGNVGSMDIDLLYNTLSTKPDDE